MAETVLVFTLIVFFVIIVLFLAKNALSYPLPDRAFFARYDIGKGKTLNLYLSCGDDFSLPGIMADAVYEAVFSAIQVSRGRPIHDLFLKIASRLVVVSRSKDDLQEEAYARGISGANGFTEMKCSLFGLKCLPYIWVRHDMTRKEFQSLVIHELIHAAKWLEGDPDSGHEDKTSFGMASGIEGDAIRMVTPTSGDDEMIWRSAMNGTA